MIDFPSVQVVPLEVGHWPQVRDIYATGIATGHATFETEPPSWAAFDVSKLPAHRLVALDSSGTVLGWAAASAVSDRCVYAGVVEHSVYVHKDHRRKGLGLTLMKGLVASATQQQYHVMVGGIDITNTGSIALHEQLGFVHAGTIRQAAFKFGRWLDLGFYQLLLETPAHPVDG